LTIALFNHFFLKNKYGDNIKNLGARVASCFHKGERKGVQNPNLTHFDVTHYTSKCPLEIQDVHDKAQSV